MSESQVLLVKQSLKMHEAKLKALQSAEFIGDVEGRIEYRQNRIKSNKEWLEKHKAFA